MNTNHTLVNYLLHHVSRNALPGNVMLTAAKSHHARECDVMLSHCYRKKCQSSSSRDVATQFAGFESGGLQHPGYSLRGGLPFADP